MEKCNPIDLFTLGAALDFVPELDNSNIERHSSKVIAASLAVQLFCIAPSIETSDACKRAFHELQSSIDRLTSDYMQQLVEATAAIREQNAKPHDPDWKQPRIDLKNQITKTKDSYEKARNYLKASCEELNLYTVPKMQAYDTHVLMENGERLLNRTAMAKLIAEPRFEKPLADVRAAAKCLAFDLWTATGFHIARATEFMIQEYWKSVRGRPLPSKGARTWVALCKDLKGGSSKSPNPPVGDRKLIDFCILVGEHYRNPLIHPEHSLDEEDGTLLLEACKAAITKIMKLLP